MSPLAWLAAHPYTSTDPLPSLPHPIQGPIDIDVYESTECRAADKARFPAYDASTEPVFPAELQLTEPRALHLTGSKVYHLPPS